MIGIYKITNTKNSKVYIGSSTDIGKRWEDHIRQLSGNYHVNPHLQAAWNKYNGNSFTFEIIREVSLTILRKAEQFFIDKYDSLNRAKGYNKTIVISKRNEKIAEKKRQKVNSVYYGAYSKKGKLVKVLRDKYEIIKFLGKSNISTVYQSAKNSLTISGHGYYWIKFDVSTGIFPKSIPVIGRKGRHRAIQQFDLNGNLLYEWDSAVLAAKAQGLSSFNITRCLSKNNQYKGFKWYYGATS